MISRRALVVMVPFGTIGGHVVGYALAGQQAALDGHHSHLRLAGWLAGAAAAAALVSVAARPRAGRGGTALGWLAAGQMALFLGLEAAEHLGSGHGAGGLLTDPSFRWGLLAQVVTAGMVMVAAWSAQASGRRVRALLSGRVRRVAVPRSASSVRRVKNFQSTVLASSASERGPPRHLVTA